MGSAAAFPALLVLLGVVLVLAGLIFTQFALVVVGAIVAIAGGGFGVLSMRRGPGA